MRDGSVIFDPLLGWPLIVAAAFVVVLAVGVAVARGLSGWWLRALAGAALIAALLNPALQTEEREGLSDIVIAVLDESASQGLDGRPDQSARALARLEAEVAALENTELRVARVGDGEDNEGTLLMGELNRLLAEVPRARLAGAFVITDGQIADAELAPELPAPLHAVLTGREDDWDRRLVVKTAPAFAIVGEPVTLTVAVEDQGRVPPEAGARAELEIAVDGEAVDTLSAPIGEDVELSLTLPNGGTNVLQFTLPEAPGELTDRNNSAIIEINGVRDRLRVLLVSGEPHPGERTWRNLLKSDSAVDLVHFTILRPPEKQDGVPVGELSLIAFPTRELFLDKIDEFDLIVFDRYKRRGILPSIYIDNVRAYVENGGAVLIAAGPDFASADSLYRSPLSGILPAAPTGRVIEEGFTPLVTDLGERHPVTAALEQAFDPAEGSRTAGAEEGDAPWGRWMRLIELRDEEVAGDVVMSAEEDRPLLVLDEVGEGRVALMASDHAWLWNRGFEGGGPQLELLRRLAHWLMKEPELDAEALVAGAEGLTLTIERRTLAEEAGEVTVTAPDGTETQVELEETRPGRFTATWEAPEIGLYRLAEGEEEAVIALGPAAPAEFEETIATDEKLLPALDAAGGGALRIEEGPPDIRTVRPGRPAAGRGWLGITPREAFLTSDIRVSPILPAWALLLLSAALMVGAWLREGRR